MPNPYEPNDASHEFTWTAPPATNGNGNGHAPAVTNGNGNGNGHSPAATNGNGHRVNIRAEQADPVSSREDLELATGSVLLFAQRVADDTIADARREADRILEGALAALPAPTPPPPAPAEPDRAAVDAHDVAELRERAEQLQIESRLRNLLMNDLVECVAELSMRVEREIGEAMQLLEHARERALADFSAINALARLAGMPPDAHPGLLESVSTEAPPPAPAPPPTPVTVTAATAATDEPLEPVTDSFVIDLRDALNDDRNAAPDDEFEALFASRGVYMESRESRRSRWIRSAGLFSTVLGNRTEA